jgi:hypothetical protein
VSVSTNVENAGLEDCVIANGIGGFNRTHVRSVEPEALSIVCFNECADCEVSVSELADVVNQVNVFPVPAQDVLSVRFNSNVYQNITLRVVNLTGQVVLTQNAGTVKPGAHTIPMNVSNLASGVYFLEIGNETANQVVRISVR